MFLFRFFSFRFLCLLSLILSFCLVSNCYAYTLQDLEDYLNYYHSEVSNGSNEWGSNTGISRLYDFYINNYSKFVSLFGGMSNNTNYNIRASGSISSTTTLTFNLYNVYNNVTSINNNKLHFIANNQWYIQNKNNSGWGNVVAYNSSETKNEPYNDIFLNSNYLSNDVINLIQTSNNIWSQKQWTYIVARGGSLPIYTNNSVSVPIFDIRIGQDWNINNVDVDLYKLDNGNKVYLNNVVRSFVNSSGTQYAIWVEVANLDNDNTYYIDLKYNGNVWRYGEEGQRVIKGNGSNFPESNTSGDNNSNIDLTETNKKLDNINNSINYQGQEINNSINYQGQQIKDSIDKLESGEKARDDFWRSTYDSLFTLSSGDVNEIYNTIVAYFPSGDSPVSVFETIFGGLNNEPDDFIIRWDDIPMFFSIGNGNNSFSGDFIKANSMNFSKLCRDNETFGIVKFWVNIFVNISFYLVYAFSFYGCILTIFGVYSSYFSGPEIEEEHRQIGFINDWRN